MSIIKKGVYKAENVSALQVFDVAITEESKVETVQFEKNEYLRILEEGRMQGYQEGKESGYKEGFSSGMADVEAERQKMLAEIELMGNQLGNFLNDEALRYIDTIKGDILELIKGSIDKIFLNAVSDETIMTTYTKNLLSHISSKYKHYKVVSNSYTLSMFKDYFEENNIEFELDNKLSNYDFVIHTDMESVEYYLNDSFLKIQELFK